MWRTRYQRFPKKIIQLVRKVCYSTFTVCLSGEQTLCSTIIRRGVCFKISGEVQNPKRHKEVIIILHKSYKNLLTCCGRKACVSDGGGPCSGSGHCGIGSGSGHCGVVAILFGSGSGHCGARLAMKSGFMTSFELISGSSCLDLVFRDRYLE